VAKRVVKNGFIARIQFQVEVWQNHYRAKLFFLIILPKNNFSRIIFPELQTKAGFAVECKSRF